MRTLLLITLVMANALIVGRSQRPDVLLIRDVRVFDGERTIGRTNVVIRDGKIQSVSAATESAARRSSKGVDAHSCPD